MLPEGLRCVEPLAFMTEMDDDAEMELYIGIAAGAAITLITGQVTALELMGNMGGVSGMFETILVTLLVASLCGLIRVYGGFESILAFIRRVFRDKRGGQLGIGLLVGLMDITTANNTVAIVMAGPIAKEVAEEYGISPKRSAFLLDTSSRAPSPTAPRCWWPFPPVQPSATPSAPLTSSPCCSSPSCCACFCSTKSKASCFTHLFTPRAPLLKKAGSRRNASAIPV